MWRTHAELISVREITCRTSRDSTPSLALVPCTQAAPQKVITSIINAHEGIKDDTSIVVVDLLPPGKSFSDCTRSPVAGCMACMCAPRPSVAISYLPWSWPPVAISCLLHCVLPRSWNHAVMHLTPDLGHAAESACDQVAAVPPSNSIGVRTETPIPSLVTSPWDEPLAPHFPCCRSGKKEDPEAPPPAVDILERVDVAQLAGLMPEAALALPAWFTPDLREELLGTMVRLAFIYGHPESLKLSKGPCFIVSRPPCFDVGFLVPDACLPAHISRRVSRSCHDEL